jgi:hypothetical protein
MHINSSLLIVGIQPRSGLINYREHTARRHGSDM